MRFILTFMTLWLATAIQITGQPYSEIRDVKILEKQHIVLEREYPRGFDTLEILGHSRISYKYEKIIYREKGVYCEAILNTGYDDMMLVASGVAVPEKEMPGPVMDAFRKSEYGSWKIVNTLAMRTPYDPWFFAIDVQRGDTFLRIFYNKLGTIKKSPY